MVDLYLYDRFFGYQDSYNYYDIDVDKILLYRKSDNEYVIRYNDVYRRNVVPLQSKIKNFYGKTHKLKNNITLMSIQIDDKELFKKCREIWNRIIELIGINKAKDFVNTIHDYTNKFNYSKGNYSNELVIALHSVFDNYLKTSLIQLKKQKFKYINKSFH